MKKIYTLVLLIGILLSATYTRKTTDSDPVLDGKEDSVTMGGKDTGALLNNSKEIVLAIRE